MHHCLEQPLGSLPSLAALPQVENLVRELRDAHDHEKITALVAQLGTDLAESPQSNLRKGALHALAGTAIGLREDVGQLLPQLLQPVLGSFSDQDARVRYYGCEALYNIAKVARAGCVKHFNPIFDGLFKLSADTDISVQRCSRLRLPLSTAPPPSPSPSPQP